MRFSASAFAPACASPNHCETDPLRLYPDASGGEAAVTRVPGIPRYGTGLTGMFMPVSAGNCGMVPGNGWRFITVWKGGWNTGRTAAISICLREIWR